MISRILLWLFPGDPEWLWRRICCVGSVATIDYGIVIAAQKSDSASITALGICLAATLGAYMGGSVTDSHLKRQADRQADGGQQ